jgi:hypothetical protein
MAYAVIVTRGMSVQTTYRPVFSDWLFNALLPFVGYVLLPLSALAALFRMRITLFGVGAGTLLLLFIGIHNAWDAVAYHVFVNRGDTGKG